MNIIRKLKSLAITSSHAIGNKALIKKGYSYESARLIEAARCYYDDFFYIDPMKISIDLVRNHSVRVYYQEQDISGLSTLLIRSTKGIEIPTKALVNSLSYCGCDVVDPLSRFSGTRASKMMTTFYRHESNVGSNSYIAFDLNGAERIIKEAERSESFPLILKPLYGKGGQKILKLIDSIQALDVLKQHFIDSPNEAILLQSFEEILKEYRVLMIHGHCLGIVEKVRERTTIAANAAQGIQFQASNHPDIENYVKQHVSDIGLLGVDVATTKDDRYIIIEANRAPEWQAFDKAVGKNVAEDIIRIIANKTALSQKENP
jgi:carbamoylphosphate synthase large subunit